jgi:hypothetical protein
MCVSLVSKVRVRLSLCLIKYHAMKMYGERSTSQPSNFTSMERDLGTHWIGGWVAQESVWIMWTRENVLPSWFTTQSIAIPTELPRLLLFTNRRDNYPELIKINYIFF